MLGMPGGFVSSGAAFVMVPRWKLSAGCARTGRLLLTLIRFAGGAARGDGREHARRPEARRCAGTCPMTALICWAQEGCDTPDAAQAVQA